MKINPFNVVDISARLDQAINMPPNEKEQRIKIASNYVERHSTLKWAESFLKDLKRTRAPEKSKYMVIGFGLNLTFIKTRQGFEELDVAHVENCYEFSKKRLIFIDYEGTLPTK